MKKVWVVAVALMTAMVLPAYAAEWEWFGSTRVMVSWSHFSDEASITGDSRINGNNGVVSIPKNTSKIGARIKASDTLGGYLEIGQRTTEDTSFRNLHGIWNFGPGTMKVGHMEMPISTIYALILKQDESPCTNTSGQLWEERSDSIQFQFGGLELAVAKNTSYDTKFLRYDATAGSISTDTVYTVEERVIPRLEAVYTYKTDTLNVKGGLNFQTYKVEDASGDQSHTIDSWTALVGAKYAPGTWQVSTMAWYGQNPRNHQICVTPSLSKLSYQNAYILDDDTYDSNVYSVIVSGKVDINSSVSIGAGVNYMNSSVDIDDNEYEDDLFLYYLNTPLNIAPGVSIVPEVGMLVYGDDERNGQVIQENGEEYYFSTRFMINF